MSLSEKRKVVLAIAAKEIGTKEKPVNQVKYNDWIYSKIVSGPQYPWCAAFVSWVFNFAQLPLGRIDVMKGFVGCPYALANVHKWGKIVPKEQALPGDIVFFDWNLDKKPDHVGILEAHEPSGKSFTAIEGNTGLLNNSNGGEVMRRSRSYNVAVFVRPNVYGE
jgi:hypothetical protein